jgi:radical SAM protein with 4Fe4S-binding SPASM domain
MATDEETWDDVEPTLLLSQRLGAFAFAYSPVMPFGRGKRNYRLWNRDQRAVFETDQRLKFQYKEFIHVLAEDSIVDLELPGGCGAGHRSYAMDPSGRIRPCVTFDEGMAIYGSVETHSLAELFQNELVDAFANVIPPHQEICGSCQYRLFCQGCALRALVGAQWLGEEQCAWLHDPANRHWTEMVKKYSVSPA